MAARCTFTGNGNGGAQPSVRKKDEETVPEVLAHLGEQLLVIESAKIEVDRLARRARAMGATWQGIAWKLRVTPQEARQRFGG